MKLKTNGSGNLGPATPTNSAITRSPTLPIERGSGSSSARRAIFASESSQNQALALVHHSSAVTVSTSRSVVSAKDGSSTSRAAVQVSRSGGSYRGGDGESGSGGTLPFGVLGEPTPSCLYVASTTVTEATR